MPRRKEAPAKHCMEYTVQELLLKNDIDPLDEMIKMYQTELPWPVDGDGNELKDELRALLNYWEPAINEKGKKCLRLKTDKRIELMKELAQYVRPKLRGQEIRGTVDHTINVTIQTYDAPRQIEKPRVETIETTIVEKE